MIQRHQVEVEEAPKIFSIFPRTEYRQQYRADRSPARPRSESLHCHHRARWIEIPKRITPKMACRIQTRRRGIPADCVMNNRPATGAGAAATAPVWRQSRWNNRSLKPRQQSSGQRRSVCQQQQEAADKGINTVAVVTWRSFTLVKSRQTTRSPTNSHDRKFFGLGSVGRCTANAAYPGKDGVFDMPGNPTT